MGGQGGRHHQDKGGSDDNPNCVSHTTTQSLHTNVDSKVYRLTRPDLPQSRMVLRTERCGCAKDVRSAHKAVVLAQTPAQQSPLPRDQADLHGPPPILLWSSLQCRENPPGAGEVHYQHDPSVLSELGEGDQEGEKFDGHGGGTYWTGMGVCTRQTCAQTPAPVCSRADVCSFALPCFDIHGPDCGKAVWSKNVRSVCVPKKEPSKDRNPLSHNLTDATTTMVKYHTIVSRTPKSAQRPLVHCIDFLNEASPKSLQYLEL